jgi:hypothetical protein
MAGNDASADPSVVAALLFGGLSTGLDDSANARASPTAAAVCVQPGQCPSSLQPYDARSGTTAGYSTPDASAAAARHARHDAPSAVAARPEFFFSGNDAATSTAADPNGDPADHASAAAASEQP